MIRPTGEGASLVETALERSYGPVRLDWRSVESIRAAPQSVFAPDVLLTGSVAILIWPSLIAAALTRIADATLRNSIHRSSLEIIYMAVPPDTLKTIKTFLDVVIERAGDASAGFIILLYGLVALDANVRYVHFVCLGLLPSGCCSYPGCGSVTKR